MTFRRFTAELGAEEQVQSIWCVVLRTVAVALSLALGFAPAVSRGAGEEDLTRAASPSSLLLGGKQAGPEMVTNSGGGTHSVPITVPPGIAGQAPKLSLDYNSQSQNNDFLGLSWSLNGLPKIERCAATVAQDAFRGGVNYDGNDRFCIEGARLIAVPPGTDGLDGAQYRTEIDLGIRVISNGSVTGGSGPSYFVAWTKAGEVLEFGHTLDSKIEAQGKTSVRVWALNKKSDANTNYFTVTYTEDNANGDYRPARIDYTGNSVTGVQPNRSVRFVYEGRGVNDLNPIWIGGSVVKSMLRLRNVQTFVNTGLVKDYRLSYEDRPTTLRNALIQIEECAAVAPSTNCLPKKTYGWQLDGFYDFNLSDCPTDCASIHTDNLGYGNYVGDFDGDGKSDVLSMIPPNVNNEPLLSKVSRSTGNQTTGSNFQTTTWNFPYYAGNLTCNWVGDFNGDGKADMARYVDQTHIGIYLSTGSNFTENSWDAQVRSTSSGPAQDCKWNFIADFNGDGKSDVLAVTSTTTANLHISTGSGFIIYALTGLGFNSNVAWNFVGDFNGDGKADIAAKNTDSSIKMHLANLGGDGFAAVQTWSGLNLGANPTANFLGDFNGDGKIDILAFADTTVPMMEWVHISTGAGFTRTQWGLNWFSGAAPQWFYVGDFNGDGRTDVAAAVVVNDVPMTAVSYSLEPLAKLLDAAMQFSANS